LSRRLSETHERIYCAHIKDHFSCLLEQLLADRLMIAQSKPPGILRHDSIATNLHNVLTRRDFVFIRSWEDPSYSILKFHFMVKCINSRRCRETRS
jgi:hypothetical protein